MTRRLRRLLQALAILLLGLGGWWAARALLGVHTVHAGAEPLQVPDGPFSSEPFAAVLADHVVDGGVDWEGLVAHDGPLRRYVATLAVVGPETRPALFPTRDDRLAWALNAYNAAVMLGVVDHWPIATVHDVHGPIEPVPGFGFFWAQRFELDGRTVNLYSFENDLRERFGDARIHAAINCASASCPDLGDAPYEAARLDAMLERAARRFCNEPRHVSVREEPREILLSSIFDWFSDDFERHAVELGLAPSVLDWIIHYADPLLAGALRDARAAGFTVRYAEYDWSLDAAVSGPGA